MSHLIPVPFLVVTVTLLVRAELRGERRQVYLFKPLSTALVILVAALSFFTPTVRPMFTWGLLLGLVLSLGGDVALMFESNRAFLIGLVLFLLAHVAYAVVLTVYNGLYPQDLITGAVLALVGAALFFYLRPGLGPMQAPVILYIVVILIMVNRALSTFFGVVFTPTQAWLLGLGAVLFMLSDVMLAVDRFRLPFRWSRLSLYLYYGGQLLIALSPSYFA